MVDILKPTADELKTILEEHRRWLQHKSGSRADLSRAVLRDADLRGADLRGADLSRAVLSHAVLSRADLRGADLSGAVLSGAVLRDAVLSRADLSRAVLSGADLSHAVLSRADLSGADLSRAVLRGAVLSHAVLSHAVLRDADLSGAVLSGAVLSGAVLRDADLRRSVLATTKPPYDWAKDARCILRVVADRVLVLGSRTRNQPHMGGPDYDLGRAYVAPIFSRDAVSECHPGLYVAGGPDEADMLVAFWLDEMFIVSGADLSRAVLNKCRVPRFRTLRSREDFESLTAADMEECADEK